MAKLIQLITKGAAEQISTIDINNTKMNHILTIKAIHGNNYEIRDTATNFAPQQLLLLRKGKDLWLKFNLKENDSDTFGKPDIIIENYYDSLGNLTGLSEDGKYYSYAPQEGNSDLFVQNIDDNEFSYQSLGYSINTNEDNWTQYALGLLVLGAFGVAAGGGGGGGNDGDTTPPSAPTVIITDDVNNDGLISNAEFHNPVNVRILLPVDANDGDTLTATDGTITRTFILDSTNIGNGYVDTYFDSPGEGNMITVTATVTDTAGNIGPSGSDSATIDTTADNDSDGNSVTIESITTDSGIAGDFITNDTNILIHGTVDLDDNNTLSVTFDGITYTDGTDPELTVDGSGNWTLDIQSITLSDDTYPVVAIVTDIAGNTANAMQNVVIDTTPPTAASVVIVLDADNDGTINASEKGLNATTNVDIGIPIDAQIGDVITVTNNLTGIVIATYTVDGTVIIAGSTQTITGVLLPTGTDVLTVTTAIQDLAGNIGPSASDSAIINQAPIAIANNDTLLGLVGADALGDIIDISHQAVFAIDANKNITEAVVTYATLVNIGNYHLTASAVMAQELGLIISIDNKEAS
jgi:hypothetical protein